MTPADETSSRDKELYALVQRVVELPEDACEAVLAGVEPGLAAEVRSILAIELHEDAFEAPPRVVGSRSEPDPFEPGDAIGPYRLLGLLGEGGMGRVYLAEQDQPVRRRVALKVLREAVASGQALARFEAERHAMGRLDHPNVGTLLEAGTTDEGIPYFAMEFIDGAPITSYCDTQALSIEQRIRLMLDVCRGVEHAHQKLLLHRDLKPSNVLVTEVDGRPVPKLIDFGIAKGIGRQLADSTLATGDHLIGTPQYMSPEALGMPGDVDTRSDVFSLGIVLYELLTGDRPWAGDSRSPMQLMNHRLENAPRRPSTSLSALTGPVRREVAERRQMELAQLERCLRGDLDRIVMKAIAAQPETRYSSASDLGDDLERFLRDEPVSAQPPTRIYRLRKWMRRNRLAAALTATTVLALIGAGVVSWISLAGILDAKAETERQEQAASQALAFVVDLFEGASPEEALGEELTAADLLGRGVERVRDQDLDPLVRARVLHTLADVQVRLGDYDEARGLAEEALAIREAALAPDHPDLHTSIELLGNLEQRAGNLDVAAPLLQRLVDLYGSRSEIDPAETADALSNLGNLRWRQARLEEAESLHRQALELREISFGPNSSKVGRSLINLGAILWSQERFEEAETVLRRASRVLEDALGSDHPLVISALTNLSIVVRTLGRADETEALHRRVLALSEKVLGPGHPGTAASLNNLGVALSRSGRLEEAIPLYRRALAIWRESQGATHQETIKAGNNLGINLWRAGRYDESAVALREVLASRESKLGSEHPDVARTRLNLAIADRDAGRLVVARRGLEQALVELRSALGEDHRDVASTLHHMGILAIREGDGAEAERLMRQSLAILESLDVPDPILTADNLHHLGQLCADSGRPSEARELLDRALVLRRAALPAGHADISSTETLLGALDAAGE